MRYLRNITSLNNLKSVQPGGQIATILIIMMVVVLIFVLVTINMGSVSNRATRLANAADSTTLLLASKLASQAFTLAQNLGGDEVCVKGGILAIVLAVILAIIAIILAIPTAGGSCGGYFAFMAANLGYVVLVGAIGGAVGGAIGGAVVQGTFKGAVMGAIQGAVIGASIGYGAGTIGGALGGATAVPAEGAMSSAAGGEILASELSTETLGLGLEASMAPGYSTLSGAALTTTVTVPSVTGVLIGAAVPIAASVYNGVVEDNMKSEALENLAKMLTTLPVYDALREEMFFRAFTQVVDDPNSETDIHDLDGDFDYDEKIPAFENWWYDHVKDLQIQFKTGGAPFIESFAEDTLIPAYRKIKSFLPDMDRVNIECDCFTPPSEEEVHEKAYGPMERLFSATSAVNRTDPVLGYSPYDEIYEFWREGPEKSSLVNWYIRPWLGVGGWPVGTGGATICDCPSVPADPEYICPCILDGIDYFDGLRMEYEEFIDWAHSTLAADDCGHFFYDANVLDKDDVWLDLLYRPDDLKPNGAVDKKHRGDFYDTLSVGAVGPEAPGLGATELGVKQWIDHIIRARDALPACQLSYATSSVPFNTTDQISKIPAYCHEYDYEERGSLYPCNWKLINKPLTGVFADNPACSLYENSIHNYRTMIASEVNDHLASYINNGIGVRFSPPRFSPAGQKLEDRIRNQIMNGSNPCRFDNDPASGITSCSLSSIDRVDITELRLETTINSWSGTVMTDLKYRYTYDFTCLCCQNDDCCSCNAYGDPANPTVCTDCQRKACCSQIPTVHRTADGNGGSGHGEVRLSMDYLLRLPWDDDHWLTKDDFLAALSDINDTLSNIPTDTFATVDEDLSNDEYEPVLEKLKKQYYFLWVDPSSLAGSVECASDPVCNDDLDKAHFGFIPKIKAFYYDYQDVKGSGRPQATNTGGVSPAYLWTDKEGDHSVIVETGKAKFSKISREEHGNFLVNKKCLVVEKVNAGHAWVKITRRDRGGKGFTSSGTQSLGFQWNPGFGQWQTMTRKARALYDAYNVGIRDIWNKKRWDGKFPGEN